MMIRIVKSIGNPLCNFYNNRRENVRHIITAVNSLFEGCQDILLLNQLNRIPLLLEKPGKIPVVDVIGMLLKLAYLMSVILVF